MRVIEGSVLPWLLVTTTNAARNSGRASLRYRKLLSSLQRSEQATATGRDSQFQDAMDDAAALALRTLGSKDLQLRPWSYAELAAPAASRCTIRVIDRRPQPSRFNLAATWNTRGLDLDFDLNENG